MMARLSIKCRGRRVKIRCVPVDRKKRYERQSDQGTVFSAVEYRNKAT